MRILLKFVLVCIFLVGLDANASINIKSIELNDSTTIDGKNIAAITIDENSSTIDSFETVQGDLIEGQFIKKIDLIRAGHENGRFGVGTMRAKLGGEGSGG